MGELRAQERAAVEAVATHFSATWHEGGDLTRAYLTRDGRRIGIRFLPNAWRGSEVLAFVHSEGSKPAIIANAAQSLLECLRARAGNTAATIEGKRWLVLLGASALGDAYRDACSQLSDAAPFEKIVLVPEGGRVEVVAD